MTRDHLAGITLVLGLAVSLTACPYGEGGEIDTVTFRGPQDHTGFPIDQFPHDGLDCNDCHGPFDSFTVFTCIDCHTHDEAVVDPPHAAVSGYEYDSFACLSCHPDGLADGASGVDHTLFFPIDTGAAHEATACSQCHPDPGDRKTLGCAGCHPHDAATTTSQHPAVGGYLFRSDLCVRCHFDSQVDPVADHTPFKISAGAPHAPPEACLECHTSSQTNRPWAADFARKTCVGCHAETPTIAAHPRVASFSYDDASCQGCHPSGEGGMNPADHAPFYPIGQGTTHGVAACGDCHLDPANPRGNFGCTSCHLGDHDRNPMSSAHGDLGNLYSFDSPSCLECHPQNHVVTRGNHSSRRFDGNNIASGPHRNKRCSECHATRTWQSFNCSPCHDPGQEEWDKTRGCDSNKGSPCNAQEKYLYYYK